LNFKPILNITNDDSKTFQNLKNKKSQIVEHLFKEKKTSFEYLNRTCFEKNFFCIQLQTIAAIYFILIQKWKQIPMSV
jgi:hypothetical protein